jgi:LmbE family N-acetylglucosaminyl deacetylase
MKYIYTLIFSTLFSLGLFSQTPASWTSADIYLGIKKLNVLGSVLYVAAHPDDENTRLIAYFAKEKLYRTGYLSMTRGDGGQNLIGNEQGIELGLIRTQELLSARRIDGGEQFFTRAYDFGYSKSPEETFTKWDKEKILSDVVWTIRKFQPDVIITRFSAGPQPGNHGHHIASAILANEAFTAAADPNRFPEQMKYVQPWQAKRIVLNTANFGGNNQTSNDQFKFDVGGYNPLLGKGYGEIAAESRSQHKSQGFGVPAGRGEAIEFFRATGGTTPVNDLLEGVDQTWKRVNGGEAIEKITDSISSSFDFLHPEKSVKGLVRLYAALNAMPDGYWRNKKMEEVKVLIEQCSGLWMDVFTNEQFAVQTDSIRFAFQFNNRLGVNATLKKISVDGFDSTLNQMLTKNRNINFAKTFFIPATKPLTQPYWLENKMSEGYFNVSNQQQIGNPDVDPAYIVHLSVKIEDYDFTFSRNVKYKFTDPVRGELYQPLVVIPPVVITPNEDLKITMNEKDKVNGSLAVRGMKKDFSGNLSIKNAVENKVTTAYTVTNPQFAINAKNQVLDFAYSGVGNKTTTDLLFTAKTNNGLEFTGKNMYEVKYNHIPNITYFHDAEVFVKYIDVKTYNKKIGYIVGAGDKVPEALEKMGYNVTLLTDKELSRNNLSQFEAILTGVRAYNTNEWMGKHYDKLMKYVEQGGNMIVQYNTVNFISSLRTKIAPYKFSIANRRITDENAEVTFLKPEHIVLNFPNKINQDDFKGWIQERSIYHGNDFDSVKFERILSMNDPGEKPEESSLIIAKHGKGYFTYTGLVFFRELPAGVPGAYRLMANLIALNRKKAF